jgi:hypothetical protein
VICYATDSSGVPVDPVGEVGEYVRWRPIKNRLGCLARVVTMSRNRKRFRADAVRNLSYNPYESSCVRETNFGRSSLRFGI